MIRRIFFVLALLFPGGALAQPPAPVAASAMDHSAHKAPASGSAAQAREPGQAAFAAIQEIVSLIDADAATDWSKVDIAALQRHLIDMNNVTLSAEATNESVAGGVRFTVTGAGAVRDSIRRMVIGHAEAMNGVDGWYYVINEHPDGAVMTVTASRAGDVAKLRALGFIGVMSRGMHHQSHHLAIATGRGPHE